MELSTAFRDEPAVLDLGWEEVDDQPNKRRAQFGEVTLWLEVHRRPGAPRTAWFPESDSDGGGWTFALSASVRGVGVTSAFAAVDWLQAQAVALDRLREALSRASAAMEVISG